jgi:hypothetical protein
VVIYGVEKEGLVISQKCAVGLRIQQAIHFAAVVVHWGLFLR